MSSRMGVVEPGPDPIALSELQRQLDVVEKAKAGKFHLGDPCLFCGLAYDAVPSGECRGHGDKHERT